MQKPGNFGGSHRVLIDASVFIFRAWFSLPDSITDDSGRPVNALQGFSAFLISVLRDHSPDDIAVCFDESLSTSFRNQIDPNYKANRPPAPEELKNQFARCRQLCGELGIAHFADALYEADDFIYALAAQARAHNRASVIASRDKDLLQILQAGDWLWDGADKWRDAAACETEFGVSSTQFVDYQALAGDTVDNIPGVKGVGAKTAAHLIQEFGSLELLYQNLANVSAISGLRGAARAATLLETHREDAFRSRQLAQLSGDAPLGNADTRWSPNNIVASRESIQHLGLGAGTFAAIERLKTLDP